MKKQIWIAATLCVATTFSLQAQENTSGDLNRQMEVTRAYEPTVNSASKLGIDPNLNDTVALRPDFNYSVTSTPITGNSELDPIRAAAINTSMQEKQTPFYLKVGVGIPLQSLLDFYYNAPNLAHGKLGAYINHYGSWSKIKNDLDIKAPASETRNRAGFFGEQRFGRNDRYMVGGELFFDYRQVSRYGYYNFGLPMPINFDDSAEALRQNFTSGGGNIVVGNSFEDLSDFNFRFGLNYIRFEDRFQYKEQTITGFAELGKQVRGKNDLTLKISYAYTSDLRKDSGKENGFGFGYRDKVFTVAPHYTFGSSKWKFGIGLDYVYNNDSRFYFHYLFPQLSIVADIANGNFTPFLEIDGHLQSNDYRTLAERNPYIDNDLRAANTAYTNARIGFKGDIASVFSYRLYGGATGMNNMSFFVTNAYWNTNHNTFTTLTTDAALITAGGELEGRISGAFGITASFQYFHYILDYVDIASGMPKVEGSLGLKYRINPKLQLNGGVRIKGTTEWYELHTVNDQLGVNSVPTTYDIYLGADYQVSKLVGIFVNTSNLANQKLYPYNHYAGLGINVLAGVKLSF